MIELKIKATPKQVEVSNYLLSQAIKSLQGNPDMMKAFMVTKADLKGAERFRKKIVNEFLNPKP